MGNLIRQKKNKFLIYRDIFTVNYKNLKLKINQIYLIS